MLEHANRVLVARGQPPLARIASLYHEVDEHFLATFPELDHYPGRCGAKYWGAWPCIGGKPPVWPAGSGPRIFAYLKPFAGRAALVEWLCERGYPTILFGRANDSATGSSRGKETLRVEQEPLDLDAVGRTADLVILNGNHGSTVAMLLAGKPTLQIPIALEQGLFSLAVERLGAGAMASADRPDDILARLEALLNSSVPAEAARYATFDPRRQVHRLIARAEALIHG